MAEALRSRPVFRVTQWYREDPGDDLCGKWEDRHPLNVPGPFYGAETDTCCDGPAYAPKSLLHDESGAGFVWRQPRDEAETIALMAGASSDPFCGYAWDGDAHWTPALVRAWWSDFGRQSPAIDLIVRTMTGPRPEIRSDHKI